MSNEYTHSVYLDASKCTGCTTCVKHCPTEAIRVRDGVAVINPNRCIDCGECIRVCTHQAKKVRHSKFADVEAKWKIALPAPTLYGQFDGLEDTNYVLQGLLDIGFDDVYEVAKGAELASAYTRRYLKLDSVKRPVISSACPVVLRLISLRYPSLLDNVIQMLPPMEISAICAKRRALREHPELKPEDIKVYFISPCPGKVSYVYNGYGSYKSAVDVVISVSDIYFQLLSVMKRDRIPTPISESGKIGISWAQSGGECSALFNDRYLAADGIENVIRVLDEIENGNFPSLDFIELDACPGGCVGGVMTVENPFIAKARLYTLRKYLPVSQNSPKYKDESYIPEEYFFNEFPDYAPLNRLSDNIGESLRMMSQIQSLRETLPGLDCGSCGAPTCRAFAEDCVKGESKPEECMINLALQNKASQ